MIRISHNSTVNSINRILNARSLALVGASKNPSKFGFRILETIKIAGYRGKIYPVNPYETEILGLRVYSSILDVPDEIDIMILSIPQKLIPNVLKEAIQKEVGGAVIIATGYREVGHPEREQELLDIIKQTNLRLIGPNIQGMGYIPNKLCAQTMPVITKEGPIGIITQSGSVTATLALWAQADNLGITGMVNLGNQIDLCESDFLEFFAQDPRTKAIAMYLEGPQNGRRFFQTLKTVTQIKPVVIIKPGRSEVGTSAAKSHTASIGGNDLIFTFAVHQCGAIRRYQLEEVYDATKALAIQPLPRGNRIQVFTTSGGVGSILVDLLHEYKLQLNSLPDNVVHDFQEKIHVGGLMIGNPYDIPILTMTDYQDSLDLMLEWDRRENLTDLFFFNIADGIFGIESMILAFSTRTTKPVIVCYQGGGEAEIQGVAFLNKHYIPAYNLVTRAVTGAVALVQYAEYRRKLK